MTTHERPGTLPPGAVFDEKGASWEESPRNERGEPHGTWLSFTTDGVLRVRRSYKNGKLDGYVSHFTDGKPGTPPLRNCCVPPGARELRARYHEGRYVDEVFLDEQGQPLCEDGTPWPARPPGLPEHALWVRNAGAFVEHLDRSATLLTVRYFDPSGTLFVENDVVSNRLHARRRFAPSGLCLEDVELDEHGKNHGRFVERWVPGASPYADTRIEMARGTYEHGERVGLWEFCDADGGVIASAEYGPAWGERAPSVVLGNEAKPLGTAGARWREADRLWDAGKSREALALAARAMALDGATTRFAAFLRDRAIALAPEAAREQARLADEARASMGSLLGALLSGAEPAATLCSLAMAVPTTTRASLEYVEASLRLDPGRERTRAARALLRVEHGDREGALEDAAALPRESASTFEFLRALVRVAYPSFAFAPAAEPLVAPDEELVPVEAAQPLEAVRRMASLYATRIELVRREIMRRLGSAPAWLPPDLSALLPDGLLELKRGTVRIEDEGEEGVEVSDVELNETLDLGRTVRGLLELARGDFTALSWLCWSAGLDHVALPESLTPRALFSAAAHRATVRCFRAHDELRSIGLVAASRGVQPFEWEGMRTDTMPKELTEVAAREYLELRALFFWLLFPQNQSPFQADLRQI
ncbi:MAG TPA: hypothetical protein VFV94_12000 [Polyangiaceae bacterium]|nr:hypothetical protein [Polyangiaceae bacterium]